MIGIGRFYNRHEGQTALLVGNGPNLCKTPPEWFSGYPSFGLNTIHLYEGWKPTYWCGVDKRVYQEFGEAIATKLYETPKFVPSPKLDHWKGNKFYRFITRAGALVDPQMPANTPEALTTYGIAYRNVMHVAMQLAYYMGFTTMLMIGVQHKLGEMRQHFWGEDAGMSPNSNIPERREVWIDSYRILREAMQGVTVLNISEDTCVPDDVLPRGDWHDWTTKIKIGE